MSVTHDPRYRALASIAMRELGVTGPHIALAIVSQWQCEQPPNAWPPVHNNPGFVTLNAIRSAGVTLGTFATSSPGPGFLAQFRTPEDGATAYGQYIRRLARYATARAAAARDDGAGYLRAVTSAGYGTRYTCAIGAYHALAGNSGTSPPPPSSSSGAPAPAPAPATSSTAVLTAVAVFNAHAASAATCDQVTLIKPNLSMGPIPRELIGSPCVQCAPGYVPAIVNPSLGAILFGWTNPAEVPGLANACVVAGTKPGDSVDLGNAGAIAGQAAAAALGLFSGLEPLLWLGAILVVLVLGLYVTLT